MIDNCGPSGEVALPLPTQAYLPGRNRRPSDGVVFAVAAAAPNVITAETWRTNQAYLYGFMLYRNGYYWEAHEVWEPVWRSCRPNTSERLLLQALIQIANAALKRELGRPRATARLLSHAETLLGEIQARRTIDASGEILFGVDVPRLRAHVISQKSAI